MAIEFDFAFITEPCDVADAITTICDEAEEIYAAGFYPAVEIERPWSRHNPVLRGELARPGAIRWFLVREFSKLASGKAKIALSASRPILGFDDPALFDALDEAAWDLRQKKLFLFRAERVALSLNRLEHYTGTAPEFFQRYVLFTNYAMHTEVFLEHFPEARRPERNGVQMPAYHLVAPGNFGISLINIGVGPSNAKTITDHLAVLRPDAMVMVGHCGGVRNHQEIGDLVLATTYMRGDQVLDDVLPRSIPVASNHHLNTLLMEALEARGATYRIGMVYTTGNRNWEFHPREILEEIALSRSIAVDMESATIAANGFRYRIPTATLLCVSDKPLHGRPKLAGDAKLFYEQSKEEHFEIAVSAIQEMRRRYPNGLPIGDIRSSDEPLLGTR